MNAQPNSYPQYPPPPNAQQNYSYQFQYPPPTQVAQPAQQGQPYHFNPFPQQSPAQPQAQYFRGYSQNQQQQQQQQQHQPRPTAPNSQPQARQAQQNAQASPASSPVADPGAPAPGPASPELDTFDSQLLDALNQDEQPSGQQQEDGEDLANQGDENDPVYNLPPPPENTYPSEAELEKAMHAWSLEHGYELVRKASKKNAKGEQYKRYYHCSKHGARTGKMPDEQRRRVNRKSNRQGCPMSVATVAVEPSNPESRWQIRHRKTYHNHPALDAVSLTGHRRRAREGGIEKALDGLFAIGTSTAQIMQFLGRTNPHGLFTRTDVANMKMKYKKYGTCMAQPGQNEKKRGVPSACQSCRQKKVACDSERPACGTCANSNTHCLYDHEPDESQMDVEDDQTASQIDLTAPVNEPSQSQQGSNQNEARTTPPSAHSRGRPSAAQTAATKEILNELRNFQNENIIPQRLELQSSSVEILAQSSCGNGESYRSLPVLSSANEWPNFRDSMIEAAMKENTYDVLTGAKVEPQRPTVASSEEGKLAEIEAWNEYIKQLAIYKRRNALLLSAIWSHSAPNYRNRVSSLTSAASVWNVFEDLFQPHGCETAYRLYLDLHSITLSNSADLKDYIHRLQSTYDRFKQLKLNTSPPPLNRVPSGLSTVREGGEAVPEEMVCFLFLQNLGPEWRRWVEGLCATNNIGGFGTGQRLGLKDLAGLSMASQARGVARGW